MSSRKFSRRDAIKALAAAGAALAATPYLASAAGAELVAPNHRSEEQERTVVESQMEGPLVILVKDNELLGFRGTEEIQINDRTLISRIRSSFRSRGAS